MRKWARMLLDSQPRERTSSSTYRHDLLVPQATMLVRSFPLAQRCRLGDISVRMNFVYMEVLAQRQAQLL